MAGLRGTCLAALAGAMLACLPFGLRAAEPCATPLARVIFAKGDVQLIRAGFATPAASQPSASLCVGDTIRVQRHSSAALLLANETTIRLDQGSQITFTPGTSTLELDGGSAYVITRTPKPFRVRTPFVNARVEGTEFLVAVAQTSALIAVYEGRIVADNALGSVDVLSGEVAEASAGRAPSKVLMVRPRDAVQWTLFFPTIFDERFGSGPPGTAAEAARQTAAQAYREGRLTEALASLAVGEADVSPGLLNFRAGLLLQVGRIDEARTALEQALRADPGNAEAHALLALIAVVEDRKDDALRLASESVRVAPGSAAARMALSYAQQARFDIPGALASARIAAQSADGSALVWARVAELEMSLGAADRARAAAQRAVELDAAVARTHAVLGFVHLAEIEVQDALAAFAMAIERDSADPLPRLGRGLALIRTGALAEGRREIEVAAGLDPARSIIRSYLGKAYFEEMRDSLAAAQFGLAKALDPNDPTPYLYDAVRKQSENRPVEAFEDIVRSVALNDNRAVYRSQLLLDQDRATRQVNLAGAFSDMAAEYVALPLAAASVGEDPANASAHRFLAESYARRDRHEIARVSELLQAQMLRPVGIEPLSPELAFTDLSLTTPPLHGGHFNHEASSMFESDRVQFAGGGLVGSQNTNGEGLSLAALMGKWSVSAGHFHYATDGFRPNSDIEHRIDRAFVQFAASSQLSLQFEYRQRRTENGDVGMRFDPTFFAPDDRFVQNQDESRLGVTFRPSAISTLLVTVARLSAAFDQRYVTLGDADTLFDFANKTTLYEAQYLFAGERYSVVAGGAHANVDTRQHVRLDYTPVDGAACLPDREPCEGSLSSTIRQRNFYVYLNAHPRPGLALTLGFSRDTYDEPTLAVSSWNPKVGVRLTLSDRVSFRAAAFGSQKRPLLIQQTIEPTQVMGFSQMYDDVVGSVSRFRVAALDFRPSERLWGGVEIGRQRQGVSTGRRGPGFAPGPTERLESQWLRANATLRLSREVIAGAAWVVDRFLWPDMAIPTDFPTDLRTARVPLSVKLFPDATISADVVVTPVRQRVARRSEVNTPVGSDRFTVLDLSMGYRLPRRLGSVQLEVKNALNAKFFYQDDDFRNSEPRLSPFLPVRRVMLKASLVF